MRPTEIVSPAGGLKTQRSAQPGFRPDIEGLRAVAVVAVVLFHAGVPGVGGGFVGVDVFFVISGFLITGILWREIGTAGTVGLRRFYGARARRLLPASAAVGTVTAIGAAFLLPPLQAPGVLKEGIASALYISNFWFIHEGIDYFAGQLPPSPFQQYWSLGVEEQFYLVWPPMIIGTAWLVRVARRRAKARTTTEPTSQTPYLVVLTLITTVSFALSVLITHWEPPVAFFSLPTRAWQLAAGGLIALTVGHWRRLSPRAAAIVGWAGLGVILLACSQLSSTTLYPGTAALLPVLGAVLVIGSGCATPTQGCGRVLALAPMGTIGRISYSWYLWHWPVLMFTPVLLGYPLGHPVELATRLAAALASAALAVLTLRLIENPLRFAAPIRRSALASLALGGVASAVAVAVGVALLISVPVPVGRGQAAAALTFTVAPPTAGANIDAYDAAVMHAFAQMQGAVAAATELKSVPSNLEPPLTAAAAEQQAYWFNGCMRNPFQSGHPECATGDTSSATTVALVGDSHAAMWNPAFQQIAGQRHWRLEMLARATCPLMNLTTTNLYSHREDTECAHWRSQIIARLRAEHPRLVVVSMWRGYGARYGFPSGFTSYEPAWIDSLTRLVQQLRDTGAKVLVLGPIPDPHTSVPFCLSGHLDDASVCSLRRSSAVDDVGIKAESAATTAGGGQYADLTELFCTADRCPVIVGNSLVYFDMSHLTLEYSRLLAPVIAAVADRTLAHG
jgi:peptidoglycan/LPS O-acetylase OafA/YrhL